MVSVDDKRAENNFFARSVRVSVDEIQAENDLKYRQKTT
jgi:hypothetical protein